MHKIRVAVLFGGRSAEHEVSLLSAQNVFNAIDRYRFDVVPIKVTRSGEWLLSDDASFGSVDPQASLKVALLPGGRGKLLAVGSDHRLVDIPAIDVLFPVLHGPFGEDGSVQGYAEVADVPYVGCSILASAACMDKHATKRLLAAAGLPVVEARLVRRDEQIDADNLIGELGSTLFVKPVSQGSSVGVSRVGANGEELRSALHKAFQYGDAALVEAFVEAREIECAVLERADGALVVSEPGEIVTAKHHEFYSYDAKYVDPDGALVQVPADVTPQVARQARQLSTRAFKALGCEGMARVDFFLKADGALVVNEINTIPGFTNISMYAKAMATTGISYSELITHLIEHALARSARRSVSAS